MSCHLLTDESTAYKHAHALTDGGVPPTCASHFVSALNFRDGVFGFDLRAVRASSRIQGSFAQSLRRNTVSQRRPLSVEFVKALVLILASDAGAGSPGGVYAGTARLLAMSRRGLVPLLCGAIFGCR